MDMKQFSGAVKAGLGLCAALIAACSSSSSSSTEPGTTSRAGTVEVFSWWTAGGEADGLNALIALFNKANPNVTFINAATQGGAGTNARDVLRSRLSQNQPPDSFQAHGGKELISAWVKPKGATGDEQSRMEPLSDLFSSLGWNDKFAPGVIDIVSLDGKSYSVPVNIHRANALFYNIAIFQDNSLQPPKTLDEFITVAEALKKKGISPIALGAKDAWAVTMIFENALIARGGDTFFREYFAGKKTADDPLIAQAIDDLTQIMSYTTDDAITLSWDNAAQKLVDGTAAMTFMGDWAKGYFQSKGFQPGTQFEVVPAMGTEGMFLVVTDTFGLPKGAPWRDNAIEWLKVCGSREGQDAFNPKKGSIPARKDADLSNYDEMSKKTINDFNTNTLIPSLAHGSAADPDYTSAVAAAFAQYFVDRNKDNLLGILRERYVQLR